MNPNSKRFLDMDRTILGNTTFFYDKERRIYEDMYGKKPIFCILHPNQQLRNYEFGMWDCPDCTHNKYGDKTN